MNEPEHTTGTARSGVPLKRMVGPLEAEPALRYVLDYIRLRQSEICEQIGKCVMVGADESAAALDLRHKEIDAVAEVVNQLRWINNGRPNTKLTDRKEPNGQD